MDKVVRAIQNSELESLLLGKDDYSYIFPHYNGLLNTDTGVVLKQIDEYCKVCLTSEDQRNHFNEYFSAGLMNICDSAYNTYFVLNYLKDYLANNYDYQVDYCFKIDVLLIINKINISYLNYFDDIKREQLFEQPYPVLYSRLIYDFEGITGNLYKGINTYLAQNYYGALLDIKGIKNVD